MKELNSLARQADVCAGQLKVSNRIHLDDYILMFLLNHPSFNSPVDAIHYYFNDGRKSADKLAALINNLGERFHHNVSLLEFASGYGCVSRHLPVLMPKIDFTACDIHQQAVQFISEQLRQKALISHKNPEQFYLGQQYDIIFSLSFFSHMPRTTWGKWIRAHYKHLKAGGALIFTTHGLYSKKHLGDPQIPLDGFWFKPESEQLDLNTSEYGSTLVTREFVEKEVYKQINRLIHIYKPGFWWEHQDLYVVTKED